MTTTVDRRAHAIAIVSDDALLAALIGGAVELLGYRASFPRAGEPSIDAIRRTKPIAVLIDARHPDAADETLLGRGTMSGARFVFFGHESELVPVRPVATRHRITLLDLPRELPELARILAASHPLARPRTATTE